AVLQRHTGRLGKIISAFETYQEERLRALYKLKAKERCPGEKVCTTDVINGQIARGNGRTLENFCNAEKCHLFFTKAGSIEPRFLALVDAASRLREKQLRGFILNEADQL